MNQTDIPKLLDASLEARKKGEKLWFLFTGDAGIGKSEIIQQWAESQGDGFQFIDVRLAYMEGPDMVGLTYIVNGITYHAVPDFWPKRGRGIILFEEINRGHPMTQNAVMQILTDLKVGRHNIPKDFIIAGVINPTDGYSVSEMDAALKNRFVEIPIKFSKKHFLEFAATKGWSDRLISFLASHWEFKPVTEIETGTYISPRSLEKLNIVDKLHQEGGADYEVWKAVVESVLGVNYGPAYIAFCAEDRPVLAEDLAKNKEVGLKRLERITQSVPYRGDLIEASVQSIMNGLKSQLLPLDILKDLEHVLNRSAFAQMLSSLYDKRIPGLDKFVSENKQWLISISKRNKSLGNSK